MTAKLPTPVLILGGPNAGKSHYGAQLYGRLQRRQGTLRLGAMPGTIQIFQDILDHLSEGRSGEHTPTDTFEEVHLLLNDEAGRELKITWPDYGGEQLRYIYKSRTASDLWRKRLLESERWVLMVRLSHHQLPEDLIDRLNPPPVDASNAQAEEVEEGGHPQPWSQTAELVELLQLLLYLADKDTTLRLKRPQLLVLLSCWDELPELSSEEVDISGKSPPSEEAPSLSGNIKTPAQLLGARAPLLASFLQANWEPEALSIWGLSALGRALDKDKADDAYIDDGPEAFGFVISPEGEQTSDLSTPLAWLLET